MALNWDNTHHMAATAEGWDIFEYSGSQGSGYEIQSFDDRDGPDPYPFEDDEAAYRHVLEKAAAGSDLHIHALAFLAEQTTGPRSEVRSHVEPADVRHPSGPVTVRSWTRVIGGVQHSFRAIEMPNGERRYVANRYNGYGDDGTEAGRTSGMRFGCAWSQIAFWTVPAHRDIP